MKQLATRSSGKRTVPEDSASLLMSTIPVVMHALRGEMRANRPAELSVPQFRALLFLGKHAGASVSAIADHLGLALSTTSKLVDGLHKRQYVERAIAAGDRRRATITLTPGGKAALDATRAQARANIDSRLAALSPEEAQLVNEALCTLHRIFRPEGEA